MLLLSPLGLYQLKMSNVYLWRYPIKLEDTELKMSNKWSTEEVIDFFT